MSLALCRCEASEPADIVIYFKGLATKQMCKDNDKLSPKLGQHNPYYYVPKLYIYCQLHNLFQCCVE